MLALIDHAAFPSRPTALSLPERTLVGRDIETNGFFLVAHGRYSGSVPVAFVETGDVLLFAGVVFVREDNNTKKRTTRKEESGLSSFRKFATHQSNQRMKIGPHARRALLKPAQPTLDHSSSSCPYTTLLPFVYKQRLSILIIGLLLSLFRRILDDNKPRDSTSGEAHMSTHPVYRASV